MNQVDRVKEVCKQKKIPISRLENDLGFGNAYVGGLKKGVFPSDRLVKIANYLDVTIDYIMNGEEAEMPPEPDSAFSRLLSLFSQLNDAGKEKALEELSDMVQLPKYTDEERTLVYKKLA